MTLQQLDRDRLKSIRKARKIGRPKLAKLVGLTERGLTKIETSQNRMEHVPEETLSRLSTVLQVPPLVLTGDLELTDADLVPATKPSCSCCG